MADFQKLPKCPACRAPMTLAMRPARSVSQLTFACAPCGVVTLIEYPPKRCDDFDLISSLKATVAEALESGIRLSRLCSHGTELGLFTDMNENTKQALLQRAFEATEAVALFAKKMAK